MTDIVQELRSILLVVQKNKCLFVEHSVLQGAFANLKVIKESGDDKSIQKGKMLQGQLEAALFQILEKLQNQTTTIY